MEKKIIIDIYGNIMSNDNNSSDIYVNQNDALTYIGELGGEVQITDVLSNLFQNSAKESRFMNPFTLRNLVKNGGDWDLKNNENTIFFWGGERIKLIQISSLMVSLYLPQI